MGSTRDVRRDGISDDSSATITPTKNEMTTNVTCGVIGNSDVRVAAGQPEDEDQQEAGAPRPPASRARR